MDRIAQSYNPEGVGSKNPGYLMSNGVPLEKKAAKSGLHSYSGSDETIGIRGDTSSPEGPEKGGSQGLDNWAGRR